MQNKIPLNSFINKMNCLWRPCQTLKTH